jgi:RNA polymerase sigma-70 factor (ECF subfamily)
MMDAAPEFMDLLVANERLIRKVCHLYMDDPSERDDLFQEIVCQAWRSYPNYRRDAKFTTWLYRVSLNTAISHFRRKSRRRQVEAEGFRREQTLAEDPYARDVEVMYRAIGRLSKVDKALVLLYLEDRSYDEMAEIMGMTATNVGVRLNRIRKKLKEDCSNQI